ncbi:hypothetical protein HOO65_090236 [Ceratocystis lukuohia]|uniref:Uncharacterized protein n=1 Tax=Ceratocystis lukuohia TaxID=2019550 RepID=A0ABR4M9J3_9PEZI
MKVSLASLPLFLSLLHLAQAATLEDHGYHKISSGDIDAVLSRDKQGNHLVVDSIRFHPLMKMATIYIASNEMEFEHEKKLGLSEIYTALAKEHNREPEEIDWVVTEVTEDQEIEQALREIRKSRNVGPRDDVTIVPRDYEWDEIMDTKYYMHAELVNQRKIDKIILRKHRRIIYNLALDFDSFHFHFSAGQYGEPGDETPASADVTENSEDMTWEEVWKSEWKEKLDGKGKMVSKIDWGSEEYQAAIFSGLLGLDEQWEASALMGIDTQVADWMSANKGSNDSPVSRA